MPSLRNIFRLGALFILGAAVAQAHDVLQSSTYIWLRPGQMEVSVVMARVPSRSLVDNAPDVPITLDNFESIYHALLLKSAPTLLEITLDGTKVEPRSTMVSLPDETDVQFDFVYDRPADGRQMQVTLPFIKKMAEGYVNSLSMNEGQNILGFGDQTADHPTFEIKVGAPPIKEQAEAVSPSSPPPVPSAPIPVSSPPLPVPASSPSPAKTNPPPTTETTPSPDGVNNFVLAITLLAVLLLFAIWLRLKKAGRR